MTSPDSPSLSRGTPETRDAQLLGIYGRFMRAIRRAYHQASWTAVDVALGAFNTECDTLPPLDEPKVIQSAPALSEGEPTPARNLTREERQDFDDANKPFARKVEVVPVSPSLSTSSPPDLKKMLDEVESAAYRLCEVSRKVSTVQQQNVALDRQSAARSAIELSFATLTEEIKRLKLWIPDCDVCGYPFDEHDRKNGYCFHGGIGEDATSYEAKPSEEIAHAIRTLRSENERLRQWNFDAAVNANAEIASLRATALTPEEAKCLYCLASLAGTDFEKAAREKLLFISPITDRALGPEEAAALVLWIESARGTLGWKHITIEKRAIEKLRLISARSLSGETPK